MQEIKKIYRNAYQGENVVTDLTMEKQVWNIDKEFIENSVFNNQISNMACVIGNGISRKEFDLNPVFNHFGGLLRTKKLQTYGCNALYRDYEPDFLVVSGDDSQIITEVAESGYCDNHIVYAAAPHIQYHPGKFYLIPQDPAWNSGSVATMLACFDNHKKVFLLGFDGQDTAHYNYNMYADTPGYQNTRFTRDSGPAFLDITMSKIFSVYNDVDFVRVMPGRYAAMPESWKYATNLRQISFRDFVLEADL